MAGNLAANLVAMPALASRTGAASLGAFSRKVGTGFPQKMRLKEESAALGLLTAQDARLPADTTVPTDAKAKARKSATDFEAVFLNSMFNQMFTAVEGEG